MSLLSGARIKQFFLSFVVMVAFGIYAVRQHMLPAEQPLSNGAVLQIQNALPTSAPIASSTPTVPTPRTGMYRDGQYTGAAADAYYGLVQVRAIIQNGQLSDVQFLQYPNDRGTSVRINSQALPILRTEAIRAQSAQVDGVTGASATSPAFIQSLSSALTQAR